MTHGRIERLEARDSMYLYKVLISQPQGSSDCFRGSLKSDQTGLQVVWTVGCLVSVIISCLLCVGYQSSGWDPNCCHPPRGLLFLVKLMTLMMNMDRQLMHDSIPADLVACASRPGFLVVMVATLGTGSGQPGGQSPLRVGYLSDKNRGYELWTS